MPENGGGGGFFDALGRQTGNVLRGMYGAPQDPRISGEQYNDSFQRGITQAGLQMMIAGGQGADFLSALAQGMLASQQTVAVDQANALQMQNGLELQQLAQGPATPSNMARMMMSAIGAGNIDAARAISEVLKSQLAAGNNTRRAPLPRYITKVEGDKRFQVALDPHSGQEMWRAEIDFPVSALRPVDVPNPEGEFVSDTTSTVYNALTGSYDPQFDNPPEKPTEMQAKARSFLPALHVAIPVIDSFDGNPPPWSAQIFNHPIGEAIPGIPRDLFTNAIPIGEAWLRQTTGAAYNDTEYRNAALLFIPRAGDGPEVVEQKRMFRHLLVVMTKKSGGIRLNETEEELLASNAAKYENHLRASAQAFVQTKNSGGSDEEALAASSRVMGWPAPVGGDSTSEEGGIPTFDKWQRPGGGR